MTLQGKLQTTGTFNKNILSQWVQKVTRYSSQYDDNRWNADQVIGEPKVYPSYGDRQGAWAVEKKDADQFLEINYRKVPLVYPSYGDRQGAWTVKKKDADQFLEVEFKESVYVTGIDIYETYHAGGVKAIKSLDEDGKWQDLWKTDKVSVIKTARIFKPDIAVSSPRTRNIRIEVDCTGCGTWVEIDAIQLHGYTHLMDPPPPIEEL